MELFFLALKRALEVRGLFIAKSNLNAHKTQNVSTPIFQDNQPNKPKTYGAYNARREVVGVFRANSDCARMITKIGCDMALAPGGP